MTPGGTRLSVSSERTHGDGAADAPHDWLPAFSAPADHWAASACPADIDHLDPVQERGEPHPRARSEAKAPCHPPGSGQAYRRTSATAMVSMIPCRPSSGSCSSTSSTRIAKSTSYDTAHPRARDQRSNTVRLAGQTRAGLWITLQWRTPGIHPREQMPASARRASCPADSPTGPQVHRCMTRSPTDQHPIPHCRRRSLPPTWRQSLPGAPTGELAYSTVASSPRNSARW